jgi:hypothetical protein
MEVENALALQIAQRAPYDRRQLYRLGAGAVGGIPGLDVLVGRLHHAPSE